MESISYTGRDNEDIRQSLIDLVPKLTDKWRDYNESDLGMTIIELIAGAQDMQNFYLDNQTFETYLDTAMQDKNIRSILRAMNYRIPLVVSARGVIQGELHEVRVTKKSLSENITASNNVSRRIYLNDNNVADKTVTITQEGFVWKE